MPVLGIVSLILALLLIFTYLDKVGNSFGSIRIRDKVLTMEYKEIIEFSDPSKKTSDEKIRVESHITYKNPGKLRIDRYGRNKAVEIYNGKKYAYYDIISKRLLTETVDKRAVPEAVKKGKRLEEIIKSGAYEFFGYEEKDNKKLKVIGVVTETDNHVIMYKYWIERINGLELPFKEEYFIDNYVVSQITYIYTKINQTVNESVFDISSLIGKY